MLFLPFTLKVEKNPNKTALPDYNERQPKSRVFPMYVLFCRVLLLHFPPGVLKLIIFLLMLNQYSNVFYVVLSFFPSPDVHSDNNTYCLHEFKCFCVSGHALHAQSLYYNFSSGAKCSKTEAELQGCSDSCHNAKQTDPKRK